MKMKNLFLVTMLLGGMVAFTSCNKDDNDPLSKEEAQQLLTTTSHDIESTAAEMNTTKAMKASSTLNSLQLPFVKKGGTKVFDSNYYKVKEAFDKSVKESVEFPDFELFFLDINYTSEVLGTWNYTPNGWEHTMTPLDKVIVNFPYLAGNDQNNATLTIYDITTTTIDNSIRPTGIKAKLEVDGKQVYSFEFSAEYTSSVKFSVQVAISFGAFAINVSQSLDATITDKISFSAMNSILKDSQLLYKQEGSLSLAKEGVNDARITVDAKLTIKTVQLRIKMSALLTQLRSGVDPDEMGSVTLYTTSGDKIGSFYFEYSEAEKDYVPYFKYTNGDTVPVSELMPEIDDLLGDFMSDLFEVVME